MPNRDSKHSAHPTVETVLDSIAAWVSKYRNSFGQSGRCERDDVMEIAKDLGVSAGDLREMMSKGPGAADLLKKMLVALGVDGKALAMAKPLVVRDLQRLCATCGNKKRCAHELADGTAAAHFQEFCPNAFTLAALFEETNRKAVH